MEIAVTIEGMCGLTWPRWKRLIVEIEKMGFAGLYRSDHFTLPDPPELDSLELIVSLLYSLFEARTGCRSSETISSSESELGHGQR